MSKPACITASPHGPELTLAGVDDARALATGVHRRGVRLAQLVIAGLVIAGCCTPALAGIGDFLPTSLTAVKIPARSILLIIHVLGLVLGMGAAIFLDILLLHHLYSAPLTTQTVQFVRIGSKLVTIGLALLWLSGLGFFYLMWLAGAPALESPKVWSKVTVVCLLTLNGMMIHDMLFGQIEEGVGAPLLAKTDLSTAMPFFVLGAISATGWIFGFVLGMLREINFALPGYAFLLIYLAMFGVALGLACLMHRRMVPKAAYQAPADIRNERLRSALRGRNF